MNLVEIKALKFKRPERVIFDGLNLTIPKGKIVGIMGPSGTGKTTLLRFIGRQLIPDHGSVFINGEDICRVSYKKVFKMRRKMGMLFQNSALFTDMNVFDNVALPLRIHTNLSQCLLKDLVLLKLNAVGLRGASHLYPTSLSGGMQRRVALARAIALDPDMVMYDEPFVGQDPISMGVLVNLIKVLNKSMGLTSIIVSHDVHETVGISDYLYLISGGKVVGKGTPQELMESGDVWVKQFMHGLPDGPVPFHYPTATLSQDLLGDNCYVRYR